MRHRKATHGPASPLVVEGHRVGPEIRGWGQIRGRQYKRRLHNRPGRK